MCGIYRAASRQSPGVGTHWAWDRQFAAGRGAGQNSRSFPPFFGLNLQLQLLLRIALPTWVQAQLQAVRGGSGGATVTSRGPV